MDMFDYMLRAPAEITNGEVQAMLQHIDDLEDEKRELREALTTIIDADKMADAIEERNWGIVSAICGKYSLSKDASADAVADRLMLTGLQMAQSVLARTAPEDK